MGFHKPEWRYVTWEELEAWRTRWGFTLTTLGGLFGIWPESVHNYKRGNTVPRYPRQRFMRLLIDLSSEVDPNMEPNAEPRAARAP